MSKRSGTGKGNTVSLVYELAQPIADSLGLKIWDITFEKEGALRYLRVLIERPGSVIDMDDCEKMSRPLSDILDEKDPIDEQYILEVGSPGLGRELRKPEHFKEYEQCPVRIRYIREHDGIKEFIAVINSYNEEESILDVETENGPLSVKIPETAFIRLCDDEDFEEADDE
ncbi:MAG: ribosome maturation factor RimP [Oscillospiraceae bacterium]|nr:ribosome maturation factor RimP [Oscillospiraceae bacterium]